MVSACGILVSGLLGHYQAVNDRLRALARERLELVLGAPPATALGRERLAEIDAQLPGLLARHRAVQQAVLLLYVAIALFVACMAVIGLAYATGAPALAAGVLLCFAAGLA